MALFDIRSGKKVSEDFHFDINDDSVRSLLNCENENDKMEKIEIAKNCEVKKEWLYKQKKVIFI